MTNTAFSSLGLSDAIVDAILAAGYEKPTPIQEHGIPAFLKGDDIVVQAQTGTGKTAAFVLPFVQNANPADGPIQALVLTPTRELALQVSREFERFGAATGLKAAAIYGGTAFQPQYDALKEAHCVVATPGRLLDLFRRKEFSAKNIRYFGLDEADELLSMGFEKDVLEIIGKLPKERQSFICSATMGPAITRVAQNFINEPVTINVSSDEIGAQSVRHEQFSIHQHQKAEALRRLISAEARTGAIVFANTRAATFAVTAALRLENVRVDVINGELSQTEREKALSRMRSEEIDFLVATDVAARGIDISGLPAVINYDMPESPDVYVHRTGRTGRAGQAGVAYSLVTPSDISVFHALQKFYKLEFHARTLPTETDLRSMMADQALEGVFEGLDAGKSLAYAQHMPLSRRLVEREDGVRSIAKLIAHWLETKDGASAAPKKAVAKKRAPEKKPVEDTPVTVEAATPIVEEAVEVAEAKPQPRAIPTQSKQPEPEAVQAEVTQPEPEAVSAETIAPAAPAAGGLSEELHTLLANAPRRRGRWRAARGLAKELSVDEQAISEVLESDDRFEESRKKPGQWRVMLAPEDGDAPRAPRPERQEAAPQAKEARPERKRTKSAKPDAPAPASTPAAPASSIKYVALTVNVGEEHGLNEDALRNEIVLCAGLDFDDIGRITIEGESSKVDVAAEYWEDVVAAVNGQTLAGQVLEFNRPRRRQKR
ncbi:MAG: ATP-dependent RNA helicase DeaD [Bradymonadia bacterium]|jgi:ATP-dependent RNA helicase DeaD